MLKPNQSGIQHEIPTTSKPACQSCLLPLDCPWFWKGGESLPARVGRGKSEHQRARCRVTRARSARIHAGGMSQGVSTESATENQTARASQEARVRVKRCGKSAPREAQATRHGKPHRVQGQIGNPGAARSRFRESGTDSGYRLPRQMILSPRKRADRIRLTALPKPFFPGAIPESTVGLTTHIRPPPGFSRRRRSFSQHRRQTQISRSDPPR